MLVDDLYDARPPAPPPGAGRVQRRGRARARRRARRRADRAARRRSRGRRPARAGAGRPRSTARSVCVDLAAVRGTVLGAGDELVDVSGLPARPRAWVARRAASLLRRGRVGRAGRAAAAAGRRAALPGAVLEAGGTGPHGAGRPRRRRAPTRGSRRPRPVARGAVPAFGDVGDPREHQQRLATAGRCAPAGHSARRRPGDGQDHHSRQDPRAAPRPPRTPPRIALAAPTGKAAACLQEAVREAGVDDLPTASTLHRLLGWQRAAAGSATTGFDRLPYDVIVVDETSMVSLTMMAWPARRRAPDARLVLVGDPDQLASVEAGAVLGDLARAPGRPEPRLDAALAALGLLSGVVNGVVTLDHVWRFRGAVAGFARARAGRRRRRGAGAAARGTDDLEFVETDLRPPRPRYASSSTPGSRSPPLRGGPTCWRREAAALERCTGCVGTAAARTAWPGGAARDRTVAGRGGAGARRARRVVPGPAGARDGQRLRHGPVQRRYRRRRRHRGRPAVAFPGRAPLAPSRLAEVATVHATVHRGQGSQFARVTVVLPPAESPC